MARTGVTQEQVDAAADALLKAGDRPTIERVRALLGTGSPNTLIRLVDDWWSRLGRRLSEKEARLSLPEAPPAAVDAAGALWGIALEHAKGWADSQLEAERAAIRSDRDAMARECAEALEAAGKAREREVRSVELLEASSLRVRDLQRLVAEQQLRLDEGKVLLEIAAGRVADAESQVRSLTDELREQRLGEERRRDELQAYVRSVEDRAHAEVDRAREDAKHAKQQIAVLEKEAAKAKLLHAQRLEKATERARARDLEAERLKGMLQALEARIKRPVSKAARVPRKRPATNAGKTG